MRELGVISLLPRTRLAGARAALEQGVYERCHRRREIQQEQQRCPVTSANRRAGMPEPATHAMQPVPDLRDSDPWKVRETGNPEISRMRSRRKRLRELEVDRESVVGGRRQLISGIGVAVRQEHPEAQASSIANHLDLHSLVCTVIPEQQGQVRATLEALPSRGQPRRQPGAICRAKPHGYTLAILNVMGVDRNPAAHRTEGSRWPTPIPPARRATR